MYIAVYGTLKKGYSNHRVLANSELIKKIDIPSIVLYDLKYFPAAKWNGELSSNYARDVEIYKIDSRETEINLDILEGVNYSYPDEGLYKKEYVETEFGRTLIYIYNGDVEGAPQIKTF